MPAPDRDAFRQRVLRLTDEGQRLHHSGDLAAAIDRYRLACALVREAIESSPWDPANVRQLGSMLYTLGEWQLGAADHDAAVATLDEAEAAYRGLGEEADQLVADVLIRRARVYVMARRPLSAIVAAQQAVTTCLERVGRDPEPSRRIDAARVLAHAAGVQLTVDADPDLTAAAADWALREYLRGFQVGDQIALPEVHAPAVRTAAGVAYVVHTAAGRGDVAQAAQWFATAANRGVPVDDDQAVEHVRTQQPRLRQVLESLHRHDLVATLTAPATDVKVLVPAMRCGPQVAPAYAQTLSELQLRAAFEHQTDHNEMLLGMEAHALFAAASQQRVLSMRYEFGHFGKHWVNAVVNYGQRFVERGELPVAVDAARWLSGIVEQLVPYALIDHEAHATALGAARWQQQVFTAAGDTDAASGIAQLIGTLEARTPSRDGSPDA